MLVKFSLRNYRTFREQADWSLVASPDATNEAENVVSFPNGLRLLKGAVVYGANASGKSKLIEGLRFMRDFVRTSADTQPGDEIPFEPFRLSMLSEAEPSEFEVIFVHDKVRYRYGFEVTATHVVAEWLYYRTTTKEAKVFSRNGQDFGEINSKELKGLAAQYIKEGNVRENALALSLITKLFYKLAPARAVLAWFNKLKIISGLTDTGYRAFSMSEAQKPARKNAMLRLLQEADLGIEDLEVEQLDLDKLPKGFPDDIKKELQKAWPKEKNAKVFSDVLTKHSKFNAEQQATEAVRFSMQEDESAGTMKFFSLTGPVLDVLETGQVLVVDELDSRLHPNLVCKLVALFNSTAQNPHNAQLLFNTHDTNLLANGKFRRDQIWFTEKDRYGAATLYSLAEINGVRAEDNFETNYIRGKYGAVPYLGNFNLLPAISPSVFQENEE